MKRRNRVGGSQSMDRLSPAQRSAVMARVRGKDTGPEMLVRRLAHGLGFRFRLYRRDLPGRPDLVFVRLRKVIFVNGCFWHAHKCAHGRRLPVANRDYWIKKRRRNAARDRTAMQALTQAGWAVLTVWECEIRDPDRLRRRLQRFLSDTARRR